jgi:hypothetical protein
MKITKAGLKKGMVVSIKGQDGEWELKEPIYARSCWICDRVDGGVKGLFFLYKEVETIIKDQDGNLVLDSK